MEKYISSSTTITGSCIFYGAENRCYHHCCQWRCIALNIVSIHLPTLTRQKVILPVHRVCMPLYVWKHRIFATIASTLDIMSSLNFRKYFFLHYPDSLKFEKKNLFILHWPRPKCDFQTLSENNGKIRNTLSVDWI